MKGENKFFLPIVASLGSLFRHGDPYFQAFAFLPIVEAFDFYKWEKASFSVVTPFCRREKLFSLNDCSYSSVFHIFFIYRLKMDLFNGIIAAIITLTLSSQTLCAPPQSTPSTIQILVTYVIPSKTANATHEV